MSQRQPLTIHKADPLSQTISDPQVEAAKPTDQTGSADLKATTKDNREIKSPKRQPLKISPALSSVSVKLDKADAPSESKKSDSETTGIKPPTTKQTAKASIYARGIQRIVEGVDYALERRLPSHGQVYAKLGDQVKPETIIAEGKVTAGLRVFRLGELLDVPPNKAKNYLHRTIGSRVYQGDVIAEVSKMFGLRTVQFLAPVDGVLQDFNPQTGQLTLQFAPLTFRLAAGVKGKVSQIIPDEGVYVETQTSLLFGAFSGGKPREGALRLIAPPDQPIQPQAIDARLAGYIVAGGSLISKDVINRCLAVGVKGIVSGGIAAHDLLEISGQPNSPEDVGLTLLITSGLGAMAIEHATYQFLERYQEQQVFLVPQEKMLVAPLPTDVQIASQPSQPVEFLPLKVGDAVRILSSQHVGQVATVTKVLAAKAMPFSRLVVPTCLLQTMAGDTIEIPVTNVEVVANR